MKLVSCDGRANDIYNLEENLLEPAGDLRLVWRFSFQQGKYLYNTARDTFEWFRLKHTQVLNWPKVQAKIKSRVSGKTEKTSQVLPI